MQRFKNRRNQSIVTEVRQWVPLGGAAWIWVCGSLWVTGNVLYLELAGDSTGVLIWNNSLSHTVKITALYVTPQ